MPYVTKVAVEEKRKREICIRKQFTLLIYPKREKISNMKIEQIYTGCLVRGAYYITSAGESGIIDLR